MSTPRFQVDSGTIAVLHRTGGSWHALIATARNGRPAIREARSFPDAGPQDNVRAEVGRFIEEHRPERIIQVLPASSVVCRTCTLPDADPEQLEQALRLQAEAHLLGNVPEYRSALAVLPMAPGETSRTGIVLSWPPSSRNPESVTPRPVTFAPDIAALVALLNGHRPSDPLVWLDRGSGAVAIALPHAGGAVFRSTREEAASATEWSQRVSGVLAETAISVGHGSAFAQSLVGAHETRISAIEPDAAALLVPGEVIADATDRLEGAGRDGDWWSRYGIAAGVLLAAAGELSPLTRLIAEPDTRAPSRLDRLAQSLSQPRTAVMTAIVCLLVIALAPLAVSGARLHTLRRKYPDVATLTEAIDRTESRLAMYDALERNSWSMTKLLADIVSNTPVGIELDSIRIQHSDESFSITGRAHKTEGKSADEMVALMHDLLRETRMFVGIRPNVDEVDNFGNLEFELSAKIVTPHRHVAYDLDRDFATWSLADRNAGKAPPEALAAADTEEAAPAPGPAPSAAEETSDDRDGAEPTGTIAAAEPPERDGASASRSGDPDRPRPRFRGQGGGSTDGVGSRGNSEDRSIASGPGPGAVPPPIDEATIAAMERSEVQAHLAKVADARSRVDREADPELFNRLQKEFNLLFAKLRERR